MYRFVFLSLLSTSVAAAVVACSASPSSGFGGGGSGATTGVTGGGGSTASGTGGAEGGAGGTFDPGQTDGGPSDSEICEAVSADAEDIPLDMLILLDRSGSMMGTMWSSTVSALTQFFTDPDSAEISAALTYFPVPSGDTCDEANYNPPHVPLVLLGTDAQTLVSSMNSNNASGGTPTYAAMHGSLQWATAHKDQNPEHAVIIVLASDGDPTSCDTSIPNIAALAASAYNYNGVQTYAIAIQGATVSNLNQIAQAGGGQAFDVTSDITLFKAKMDEIREQALGCEYLIPEVEGQEFEPTKVNVTYTPGGGGQPETIPQADNLGDCGNSPGWYFDDPLEPTKIFLCPASCTIIQNDPDAQVEFAFGCPVIRN